MRGNSRARAENGHFHAAILFTRSAVLAFVNRLVFAKADDLDAVDRDVVVCPQVSLHGFRAALAAGASRLNMLIR